MIYWECLVMHILWFMFVLNLRHHYLYGDAGCNRWMRDMTVFASMTWKIWIDFFQSGSSGTIHLNNWWRVWLQYNQLRDTVENNLMKLIVKVTAQSSDGYMSRFIHSTYIVIMCGIVTYSFPYLTSTQFYLFDDPNVQIFLQFSPFHLCLI